MTTVPPDTVRPARWLWPLLLMLTGCVCLVVLWTVLALYHGRMDGWVAVAAAGYAALALRLGGAPRGGWRGMLALAGTLATVLAAGWLIVAGQIGLQLGLYPWDSALKLGPGLAVNLLRLLGTPADLAFAALAVLGAPLLAR